MGFTSRHGKVIAGTEYGQPADIAPGKKGGIDNVAIRGNQGLFSQMEGGRVGELGKIFILENGKDKLVDQVARKGAAAAVFQLDKGDMIFIRHVI
jgi:hypothetical protein